MAETKKVRITLVKSPIAYGKKQKDTVQALGLNKINATREVSLTSNMQGMIAKVSHLLAIEEVE
jgi:large subunit ribosomal protein L30